MEFYENSQSPERALLIGVDTGEYNAEISMEELALLSETAGAEIIGTVIQKLEAPSPATYIGSGRMSEVAAFCRNNDIDLIIADSELTPSQINNIETKTDTRVVDRTMLILDIFAARARSSEGKLQVELAQLKYSLPFLSGRGKSMSRLGGGIGTRGPGESKLESDKRHIRRRIHSLSEELKRVEKRRDLIRSRRKKDGVITVAIVGYTNSGKSTLMNTLTSAGVLSEDKLFATLDPTARRLTLPSKREVMLVDTVGLVRRLPHQLVDAFKSTLEEAKNADLILNVCDASSDECAEHLSVTSSVLKELGADNIPVISVMNKCDKLQNAYDMPVIGKTVMISAVKNEGIDRLLEVIEDSLPKTKARAILLVPFSEGHILGEIRKTGVVYSESYKENGTRLDALVDIDYLEKIKRYIVSM